MGDPSGSSRVSSKKQNREGVVGAQSGQYCATVVERAREVAPSGSGCDNLVSVSNIGRVCADEDVGSVRGVNCDIPHRPGE